MLKVPAAVCSLLFTMYSIVARVFHEPKKAAILYAGLYAVLDYRLLYYIEDRIKGGQKWSRLRLIIPSVLLFKEKSERV